MGEDNSIRFVRFIAIFLVVVFPILLCPLEGAVAQPAWSSGDSASYGNWNLVWEYALDHPVKKVSVSPDGNYVAVVCDNWNWEYSQNESLCVLTSNGEPVWKNDSYSLFGKYNWIHDVSVSEEATYTAVGSEDETYLLHRNGSIVWNKQIKGRNLAAISSDGNCVAVGTCLEQLSYLDKDRQELWNFSAQDSIMSVAVSANGQYIAAGGSEGNVYLLNNEGNLLWNRSLSYGFAYVAISLNGEFIGAAVNGEIGILNRSGSWTLDPLDIHHQVTSVSIAMEGNLLFVATEDGGLCIYDETGESVGSFETGGKTVDVDSTPDGAYVVVGSDSCVYSLERVVVPEFPGLAVMPFFIIATLLATIVCRPKHASRKTCLPSSQTFV